MSVPKITTVLDRDGSIDSETPTTVGGGVGVSCVVGVEDGCHKSVSSFGPVTNQGVHSEQRVGLTPENKKK